MNKFKARAVFEVIVDANNVADAEKVLQVNSGAIQVLGIVPADQPWPSEEQKAEEFPRPPRNTPPSGSPGTPIIESQPEPTIAVAA